MQHNYPKARTPNQNKLSPDFIPLFGGRPVRSVRIGKDDTVDLKILLNTTGDVDAFLAKC